MKKVISFILDCLKVEYIVSIIIFLTVIYKNLLTTVWMVGVIALVLNLLNLNSKKDIKYNKWRMNVNALFSILLILYANIEKDNLFLLAGCIAFVICIFNIARLKD